MPLCLGCAPANGGRKASDLSDELPFDVLTEVLSGTPVGRLPSCLGPPFPGLPVQTPKSRASLTGINQEAGATTHSCQQPLSSQDWGKSSPPQRLRDLSLGAKPALNQVISRTASAGTGWAVADSGGRGKVFILCRRHVAIIAVR
mgnify:CR=1 FL=1